MRISTKTIYESGVAKINELQSALVKNQQQLASGKRILTPADDPVASSHALDISQSQAINAQFATNRQGAKDALSSEENILSSVTSLLQNVKDLAVNAGNGALDDVQRGYLAVQLSDNLQELESLANSRDAMGNYIFAGFNVATQPFAKTSNGTAYVGDQGQRMLQVAPSRTMSMSDPGDAVFQNIRNGNGTFVTAPTGTTSGGIFTPTNTGSGIISPGAVVNPSAVTGNSYRIAFNVTGGVTTYDIINTTTSTTLSAGNAYTSGQAITFAGMQVDVQGSPANGDSFTVKPSTNQSIFATISNLISTLNSKGTGTPGSANLSNGLNTAYNNIDNALSNVLSVRASVGSRLKEIDELDDLGSSLDVQYSSTLSDLQDVDYAKAITELNTNQTILDAAQKSFVKISGLSLFSLL